jgi:hypothetical protein
MPALPERPPFAHRSNPLHAKTERGGISRLRKMHLRVSSSASPSSSASAASEARLREPAGRPGPPGCPGWNGRPRFLSAILDARPSDRDSPKAIERRGRLSVRQRVITIYKTNNGYNAEPARCRSIFSASRGSRYDIKTPDEPGMPQAILGDRLTARGRSSYSSASSKSLSESLSPKSYSSKAATVLTSPVSAERAGRL